MKPTQIFFYFSFVCLSWLGFMLGCQPTDSNTHEKKVKPKKVHQHTAPHGGTLVVLGHEFAHLELVLNKEKGELTIYVLDGEAQNGVRLTQPTIVLEMKTEFTASGNELELQAIANSLSGEKVGDSSVFIGRSDTLVYQDRFSVKIKQISVKGQNFQNLSFPFPEGNETGHTEHNHEHDH